MGFDAWGNRRDPYLDSTTPVWMQWSTNWPTWLHEAVSGNLRQYTPRGFTGHEHIDHFGIIHMNGRIYDSALARFMQADSYMEDVGTLNRYTYVHNNPFVYTDPSGHSSWKKWARIAASVAISIYTGGSAGGAEWGLFGGSVSTGTAMTTVAIGGALSSAVATGSWDGAYWGAFTGQAFFAAGQWLASSDWARGSFAGDLSGAGLAAKTVSHGLIGGTAAHLQGGKFGHGFISSGASAAITPYASDSNRFGGNPFAQGTVIALVGGSVSSLTGGKFANGAVTAAMAFAFNHCTTPGNCDDISDSDAVRRGGELLPGWDVGVCTIEGGCTGTDWVIAGFGVIPGGKVAKSITNFFKSLRGVIRGARRSPDINPRDVANRTPEQINALATERGLIARGPNPQAGRGAYVDPVTGNQRVLCHTNCTNPHAHVNNPQGQRLDINGNVVPPESPAAHLPIDYP